MSELDRVLLSSGTPPPDAVPPHHSPGGPVRVVRPGAAAPMFTADYTGAEVQPSPNFWPGNHGRQYIVIHATASGGQQDVPNFDNPAEQASTTYAISRTGKVVQYVREADTHWGNCCALGESLYDHAVNHNWTTIAIECEKCSDTNEEPLLPAQYQALLLLVRDVARRNAIPLVYGTPTTKGILFHHDLDPVTRARCPGAFPYDRFISDLAFPGLVIRPLALSSRGEVAAFVDVSQMEASESELECGYFAVAEALYAGDPATGTPLGTPEDVDMWADTHGGITTQGVSTDDIHTLLRVAALSCLDMNIAPGTVQWQDIARVQGALARGYGVIVVAAEVPMEDEVLHGNPYSPNWTPSGTHVLNATGLSSDSNLFFHDTAAILGGIFGKIAPQPRTYLTRSIEMHWATIIQFPWCGPIPNNDPLTWPIDFIAQGGTHMGTPIGWKLNAADRSLTAPNGVPVIAGFANYILTHPWDANNYPLGPEFHRDPVEASNPANGAGQWQNFRTCALAYTTARGVYLTWIGSELQWFMNTLATLTAQVATLTAHVLQLETVIEGQPIPGGIPQSVQNDIAALLTAGQAAQAAAVAFAAELNKLSADAAPVPAPGPSKQERKGI